MNNSTECLERTFNSAFFVGAQDIFPQGTDRSGTWNIQKETEGRIEKFTVLPRKISVNVFNAVFTFFQILNLVSYYR